MADFASKGVGGTALGLGIAGLSVALLNNNKNGNGILGNILGGGVDNQYEEMRAENTLLKSYKYSDDNAKFLNQKVNELSTESAVQKEQIASIQREAALREQIMDGKIARVADAATCGINNLQGSLMCLQDKVNGITRTFVPAASVTPLPAPWPYPPVPPYGVSPVPPLVPAFVPPFVPPVVPPTETTSTTTTTTNSNAG